MKERKRLRIPEYDYGQPNGYFITISTKNQKELFGKVVAGDVYTEAKVALNDTGLLVEKKLFEIEEFYPDVFIESYVVMPNHIHILFVVSKRTVAISQVVKSFKRGITMALGDSIWQKSFYDHVIRNEADRLRILEYIHNNPAQWSLDRLNPKSENYFVPLQKES